MTSLKNNQKNWVKNEELVEHILSYFQSMFLAAEEKGPKEFLDAMEGWVTEVMRTNLSREYMAEEVHLALK